MGSAAKDLEKFLKATGLQMLEGTCYVKPADWEPLTLKDIDDFRFMDLDRLNAEELEDLLDHLEDLLDVVEDGEPDGGDAEAYAMWEYRLGETEDMIRHVRNRLDAWQAG